MANSRKARTGLLKDRGSPTVTGKDHHKQSLYEYGNKDRTGAHKRKRNIKAKKKALKKMSEKSRRINRYTVK